MLPLLLIAIPGLLLLSTKGATGNGGSNTLAVAIMRNNPWNLPDIDPGNQGGHYVKDYDESFEAASGKTGVPFALLKAHALRECGALYRFNSAVSFQANATHYDNESSGSSYGLMQVEWNGNDRFAKYGFPDSELGSGGAQLFDPDTNCYLGACIIRDNLNWLKGNLRDAINAYNTGRPESSGVIAPGNYVDDVLGYYTELIGGNPLA